MARPKIEFRIKRNGNSVQVFDAAGYAGTISLPALCRLLRSRKVKSTSDETAQTKYLNNDTDKEGCGTNTANVLREGGYI